MVQERFCEHPPRSIQWDQTRFAVVCRECAKELTLRGIAEEVLNRPGGRSEIPAAKLFMYAAAEEQGVRQNRSMMVTFRPEEWAEVIRVADMGERSPEEFVRTSVLRMMRKARDLGC